MMSCARVVELLTDYLDGVAPAHVEAHLAECAHCERYLAQLRATIGLAGRT
jgi:anti-sigma factor RsiW